MFLRNCWYVAAWGHELEQKPISRTLLEERVVLFRMESGGVAALEDRCPHRHVPLSLGICVGDNLQCGYHGLNFDRTGACVSVPSQSLIPPRARVKSYPVVERYGWVWVWMGDTAIADPALIPDFSRLTNPDYAAVGKTNHVKANYRLVTDNLMDLTHVGFVHTTTIGNAAFGSKGKLQVCRNGDNINATRLVPDVPPPPLYVKSGVLPEGKNVDRWTIIDFIAPSFVIIHTGGAAAGTGALEGKYKHGLNLWVMNAMTPETETSTHYFWASVRAHAIGDKGADTLFFTGTCEAFEEDRAVLEAQQAVLGTHEDSWACALKSDAASIESRRVLDRLIAEENAVDGAVQPQPVEAKAQLHG